MLIITEKRIFVKSWKALTFHSQTKKIIQTNLT